MKIPVRDPYEGGLYYLDSDAVLRHRIKVMVDGKAVMDTDILRLVLLAQIRGADATELNLSFSPNSGRN